MIVVLLVLLGLFVLWLRRRAVRRRNLAGLNSVKPVFSVEPPTRRLGSRSRERL